jgi:hypothetical protein
MVLVQLGLNLGSPGSVEATWEQGDGGTGLGASCRAWWCDARVGSVCVCAWGRGSALGALGIVDASEWRVQGSVHGRSRVGLAWGIDPWAWCEVGGEVTGQKADGTLRALPGCPRRAWRRLGRRGVHELCLCTMGPGFGSLQGGGRLQGVKGGG